MADADYCEMCDLPLSQCVHGMPAPVEQPKQARATSGPPSKPRSSPRSTPSRTSATTARRTAPRRWTQPAELRPFVLSVLQDAEGPLEQDEVLTRLEGRLGDQLRAGDRDPNPRGELRWHAAARTARKGLIDEGLLEQAGPGVWELTRAGALATVPDQP